MKILHQWNRFYLLATLEEFGDKGRNGVVGINLKSNTQGVLNEVRLTGYGSNSSPLIYLDGKAISSAEMGKIKPNDIESVNVLKDKKAVEKYGEKAKDGVIEITMKKIPV